MSIDLFMSLSWCMTCHLCNLVIFLATVKIVPSVLVVESCVMMNCEAKCLIHMANQLEVFDVTSSVASLHHHNTPTVS